MRVLSLVLVGTRTTEYTATVAFFEDVLGLALHAAEPGLTVLDVPDGATVQVFGPASQNNQHFTHRVAGFRVAHLESAAAELQAAGIEIVLPPKGAS